MMRERTSWRWEFGVRRQDGAIATSPQSEYPWHEADAARYAADLNRAADQIGEERRATVIRRKRTTIIRTEIGGWQR